MPAQTSPSHDEALRSRWQAIVVAEDLGRRAERVSRICCWSGICRDLAKTDGQDRMRALAVMFPTVEDAITLDIMLAHGNPDAAADFARKALGAL